MALAISELVEYDVTTNATPYTVTSATFTAGRLYIVFAVMSLTNTPNTFISSFTTSGLTWTKLNVADTTIGSVAYANVWWCVAGSTVTATSSYGISGASATGANVSILEVTGFNTTTPINTSNTKCEAPGTQSSTYTITLPSALLGTTCAIAAMMCHEGTTHTATAGTGFTGGTKGTHSSPDSTSLSEWKVNSQTATWTVAASSPNMIGLAVEIVEASVNNTTTYSGSFTMDAILQATQTGSFTIDAILKKTQSGTFAIDSTLLKTMSGNFTIDAVLAHTVASSFKIDAILKKTQSGTFTIDATVLKNFAASFTIDAYLAFHRTASFTIDANLWATKQASFTIDSILKKTFAAAFTIDALLRKTSTGSFSIDGWLAATRTGSFTIDARLAYTRRFYFTIDAFLTVASGTTMSAASGDCDGTATVLCARSSLGSVASTQLYRRDPVDSRPDNWILLTEQGPNFLWIDNAPPLNVAFDYRIDDYDSGGVLLNQTTISNVLVTCDSWYLSGDDVPPVQVRVVGTPSWNRPLQLEDFMVLNEDYKEIQVGNLLGATGSVDIAVLASERDSMLSLIRSLTNGSRMAYLRSPFGDVFAVSLQNPKATYGAAGSATITASFVEVGGN